MINGRTPKNLDCTFAPAFQDELQLPTFRVANCDAIGEINNTIQGVPFLDTLYNTIQKALPNANLKILAEEDFPGQQWELVMCFF